MDESRIKLEARLMAIEYCVALAISKYQLVAIAQGVSPDQVDAADASGEDMLNRLTLPGLDPGLADHFSAELRDAIMDIFKSAREMREDVLSKL